MPRRTKPSFEPTDDERKLVEQMSAVGIPQESICLVVRNGIDDKTLRKHFRRELDTAATKANAKIGGTLFNRAMGGDTTAAIWWTKSRMGWSETHKIDADHRHTHGSEPVSETARWIEGIAAGDSGRPDKEPMH